MAEIDNEEVATTELSLVRAGVGGDFTNTNELKTMEHKEAIKSKDAEAWKEEVDKKKDWFDKFNVLTPYLKVNCQRAQNL